MTGRVGGLFDEDVLQTAWEGVIGPLRGDERHPVEGKELVQGRNRRKIMDCEVAHVAMKIRENHVECWIAFLGEA